ncbi:MAG: O-antigen ligase family protein [Acidobacteriota bacterium]
MTRLITLGLLLAVVFSTLAHGTVEPWSIAILQGLITALGLLWAMRIFRDKQINLFMPQTAMPILLLVIYGFIQGMAFTDANGTRAGLSSDVEATRNATLMLLVLFIAFLIAANFLNGRESLGRLSTFLVFYGVLLATFALIQHFTWEGKFYWFRETKGSAFGPFVNRNHFAGYLAMLAPFPVAMIMARGVARDRWIFYGFAAILMGIAIVVSSSRGGLISLTLGLLFVWLMSRRLQVKGKPAQPAMAEKTILATVKRIGLVTLVIAVVSAGVMWIGSEQVINRAAETVGQLSTSSTTQEKYFYRSWIWRNTWDMISHRALWGNGLGAYETAFPRYSAANGEMVISEAHNDYLQILADCGIIGGLLAGWFLMALGQAVWRAVQSRDATLAGVALACGGGIFALLVHSFSDFNLQIPSNALLFLVLAAIVSHIGENQAPVTT